MHIKYINILILLSNTVGIYPHLYISLIFYYKHDIFIMSNVTYPGVVPKNHYVAKITGHNGIF